jgi:hypothetical protein
MHNTRFTFFLTLFPSFLLWIVIFPFLRSFVHVTFLSFFYSFCIIYSFILVINSDIGLCSCNTLRVQDTRANVSEEPSASIFEAEYIR